MTTAGGAPALIAVVLASAVMGVDATGAAMASGLAFLSSVSDPSLPNSATTAPPPRADSPGAIGPRRLQILGTGIVVSGEHAAKADAQSPRPIAIDSFFDDACGSGFCIASINGGAAPECVERMCCPFAENDGLCNGKCMGFGDTCCGGEQICGFHDLCILESKTCVEGNCAAILRYEQEITDEPNFEDKPPCMQGCPTEIVSAGGMQCVAATLADTALCKSGSWSAPCLDEVGCSLKRDNDGDLDLGECVERTGGGGGGCTSGLSYKAECPSNSEVTQWLWQHKNHCCGEADRSMTVKAGECVNAGAGIGRKLVDCQDGVVTLEHYDSDDCTGGWTRITESTNGGTCVNQDGTDCEGDNCQPPSSTSDSISTGAIVGGCLLYTSPSPRD